MFNVEIFLIYYLFIYLPSILHEKVITFDIYGMAEDPSKPYWAFVMRTVHVKQQ